ncbi:MAG: glycosyl transferase [Elusimicrobia bacterium]|nr:glycosyl transferase [Elusimicrobiota bacterium]
MEAVRVFVGTDRSQLLAVKVLEHSIKRHASLPVEVIPMCDLPIRVPKDPRQTQRTGFSFSRFCIPALAGYRGRAIYMDADMLVMKDIRELWELDFKGAKVIVQEELSQEQSHTALKLGAPGKRAKQCAVMVMDCARLDWRIDDIIGGLDEARYDYQGLMFDLCLLKEPEIRYAVPFRWNSLEHLDATTCNIHYTDMSTQPWVFPLNRNAEVWYEEVRLMLKEGALGRAEVEEQIRLGYFRPSLLRDLEGRSRVSGALGFVLRSWQFLADRAKGFVPHREVYMAKRARQAAGR